MPESTITSPPYLKKGDTVAITCPASRLPFPIVDAIRLLESWELKVITGKSVESSFHQYAGTDDLRASDLQGFLDDENVKAIFAARGGYGTVRIIDRLNFSLFQQNPKWVVGFSDVTVLHCHLQQALSVQSIHGQMPLNVPDASTVSLRTLRNALFGEELSYRYESTLKNKAGKCSGVLTGGNLTLFLMMAGSVSEVYLDGKILFLEDVGEQLYSVDRMMWNLRRAGKLAKLKGLIVGGFTGSKDGEIPFGKTAEEIIMEHVEGYNFPVCYNFPAGHIDDNRALIFGRELQLDIREYIVEGSYF